MSRLLVFSLGVVMICGCGGEAPKSDTSAPPASEYFDKKSAPAKSNNPKMNKKSKLD